MPLFISYLDSSIMTLCDILRFQINPYRLRGDNYSPRISKDKSSGTEEFLWVGVLKSPGRRIQTEKKPQWTTLELSVGGGRK